MDLTPTACITITYHSFTFVTKFRHFYHLDPVILKTANELLIKQQLYRFYTHKLRIRYAHITRRPFKSFYDEISSFSHPPSHPYTSSPLIYSNPDDLSLNPIRMQLLYPPHIEFIKFHPDAPPNPIFPTFHPSPDTSTVKIITQLL